MTDAADQPFSVIVPVFNEAAALPRTIAHLLDGLPLRSELIFVCNGCTDRSEEILRSCRDERVRVLSIPQAGKALAIREGERHSALFPRFFVDADVEIEGGDLARLAARLSGPVELISPRLRFDLEDTSPAAAAAHRVWLFLPHARDQAFQAVLGVSAQGRARWGEMPNLMADDSFIASHFPPSARMIANDVAVLVRPPRTFSALVNVRHRIDVGLRQLGDAGVARPRSAGQRRALLKALATPRLMLPAAIYAAAMLAARLRRHRRRPDRWYRDETSRN